LDLNLFDNRKINNNFTNKFIEELKNALKNMMNEGRNMNETNNELDEYNLYEKKKVFLDNKSRSGNKLAWVMDDNSVCISEHGDGGPYFISETNLPKNVKVGEVYENIDGKYVYNSTITEEINEIEK
jgi:hypothetical protein